MCSCSIQYSKEYERKMILFERYYLRVFIKFSSYFRMSNKTA